MLQSGVAASIGVGLSPAGIYADVYTAAFGEDYFTGEEVTGFWRVAGVVPLVSELRKGGKVVDAARGAQFTRFDWATMQPAERVAAVVEKYGINLRGRSVVFDPSLGVGTAGKTLATDPRVLRVGQDAMQSEEALAATIAHELRHSRAYLGSGSNSETAARASEAALQDYIRGNR
jgi:hypothetical protein